MTAVAVIGLGQMGLPMAGHLVKAGYRVYGFDVQKAALQAFQAMGGIPYPSVQEAVANAEVVLTMLPSGREVAEVLRQAVWPQHQTTGQPALYIDSSTIDVATCRILAAEAATHGWPMIDAPVSGGVSGARAGTLTFMVGGETEHVERARPILMAMGKRLFHAGAAGTGQAAKMCNNMLLGILMVGTCEALHLGESLGIEPATLAAIMRESSGDNWALRVHPPLPGLSETAPANQDYQGGFVTRLMLKDLNLAFAAALEAGCATPLGSLVRNLYTLHMQQGSGALDFSSIHTLLSSGPGAAPS